MSSIAALVLWLAPEPAGAAQDLGPAAREWSGPWGGGSRTGHVEVAPIRVEPVLAWEREHEELVSNVATWGGVLYALVRERRTVKLRAFDLATGEERGSVFVRDEEPLELHTLPGAVVLCGPSGTTIFTHRGETLRKKATIPEAPAPAAVGGRFLFTAAGPVLDLERASVAGSWKPLGVPFVFPEEAGGFHLITLSRGSPRSTMGPWLRVQRYGAREAGGRLELRQRGDDAVAPFFGEPDFADPRLLRVDSLPEERWFASGLPRLAVRHKGSFAAVMTDGSNVIGFAPMATPAARCGELFVGFDFEGGLVGVEADGGYARLIAPDALPRGAGVAPPTSALGVVYFGNWALDVESRRVLWAHERLPAGVPAIPAGDGRIVYASERALSCWVEGGARAAQVELPPGAVPTRPDAGAGVVTADGRRLAGAIERLASGGVRLEVADGARELAPSELALVVESAKDHRGTHLVGDPHPVWVAFEDSLGIEHCERLIELFHTYLEPRLLGECRRLLDEARGFGLTKEREQALQAALSGVSPSRAANADRQAERIAREERRVREMSLESWLDAARWCRDRDLRLVATALAARARAILPDHPAPLELCETLVPPEFPWRDAPGAAERWARFGVALVPSGASFVGADDPLRERLADTVWAERGIVLRSPNLLFHSRVDDPEIVGACIARGELAIRALESLLGEGARHATERDPLDVRLHATKEDYLAEPLGGSQPSLDWSAGIYLPHRRVSRFFLPEPDAGPDPLGRGLFGVVAHELTHHWLDLAWRERNAIGSGPKPQRPGYWVVEGVARFVEDQVLEADRRGFAFDDETVRSLDACSQLAAEEALLPTGRLVDMSYAAFLGLGDRAVATVRLRHTLAALVMTERSVFYEQSGALVYFLVNECGPEGRERLIAYLKEVYSGRPDERGWERLGFETPSALHAAFETFLLGLRG